MPVGAFDSRFFYGECKMKTINSAVRVSSHFAAALGERRIKTNLDTAEIKRHSRRQERRLLAAELRTNLAALVAEGFEEYRRGLNLNVTRSKAAAQSEVHLAPMQSATVIAFPTPAIPLQKEVTVVRRRAFHRAVVETVRVAA